MSALLPAGENAVVHALQTEIVHEAVDAADVVAGAPTQGTAEFVGIGGAAVGIWELRAGTVTDTEVDELFVVISGAAVIDLLSGAQAGTTVEVSAGDVMRLVAGTRARWTVADHIRKIYIAAE